MVIAWIVAGVVLLAVELHHFALYALFVAVGCFAAAIVAVVGPGAVAAQVAAAVLVTAAGILARATAGQPDAGAPRRAPRAGASTAASSATRSSRSTSSAGQVVPATSCSPASAGWR